jgi:hypothetical protein
MKKLLKIIGVLAVLGILAAAYVWFFIYNKPHEDYEKADPDFVMSAEACYKHFVTAKEGDEMYTGKVLEINGIPSHVEDRDSLVILAFVFNEGMFGEEGIRCTMLPKYQEQTLALDLSRGLHIKGFCSGYNDTDVILEYCSITNKQ